MMPNIHRLEQISPDTGMALAELMVACVKDGASVGFMDSITIAEALDFWRPAMAAAAAGGRTIVMASVASKIVGTAQLIPAAMPNQPHRADVAKVLVHPQARRAGIGAALMRALEAEALQQGRWLLTLDTVVGSAGEALYASLGWQRAGPVPDYALMPDGSLCATMFMWKRLG